MSVNGLLLIAAAAMALLASPLLPARLVRTITHDGNLAVQVLLLAGWLRTVAPALALIIEGRGTDGKIASSTPLNNATETVTTALLAAVAMVIIIKNLHNRTRGTVALGAFLAPIVATCVAAVLTDQTLGISAVGYILAGVALWVSRPERRVLSIIGGLTTLTAAGSAAFALALPSYGLYPYSVYGQKSYLGGTALVGPFAHPNVLALMLVLGLPFTAYVRGVQRAWCITVISICILWTGSRSALVAILAIGFVLVLRRRPRVAVPALTCGTAMLVIALPVVVRDPTALTGRGRIWIQGLRDWSESPWVGYGPRYFGEQSQLVSPLLGLTHGHNLMVHLVITGGLVAVAGYILFFIAMGVYSYKISLSGDIAPTAFVAAVLSLGILEASFLSVEAAGLPFWLPSAVFMFSTRTSEGPEREGLPAAAPQHQRALQAT